MLLSERHTVQADRQRQRRRRREQGRRDKQRQPNRDKANKDSHAMPQLYYENKQFDEDAVRQMIRASRAAALWRT